MITSCCWAVA